MSVLQKRFFCLLAACGVMVLSACGRLVPEEGGTLSVYASFYPVYALTAMVTGEAEGVGVHCLVQPQDGCLRSYELSDWDRALLTGAADVAVIAGRGLESFEQELYSMESGPAVLTALTEVSLLHEEEDPAAEGTQAHWSGENPHALLSTAAAMEAARTIAMGLAELDGENLEAFSRGLEQTQTRLKELRREMQEIAREASGESVILMNEALFYVCQDLSLEVEGWYPRESGTDLSDSELKECLSTLSKYGSKVVLVEKQAPASLEEQLTEAGYRVARIDILSGGREEQGPEGYFQAGLANARAVTAAFAQEGTDN